MNNYTLNKSGAKSAGKQTENQTEKTSVWTSARKLIPLLANEKRTLVLASIAVFIGAGLNLLAPVLIGHAIDTYIRFHKYNGVLLFSVILLAMYLLALVANYFQTMLMGTVGQHLLFNLRNSIFNKLQELPIAFFNQNKAGDLISRINNDTDKLNQFFSQSLVQFVANIITILGAAIFIVTINWRLGLFALAPAAVLLVFTQILSPWIKRTNAQSLKRTGGMSGEISESLDNFKVIVAFNRRDYFRKKFSAVNEENYQSAVSAGIANNTLTPAYGLASSAAQLIVITYGIYLISVGNFSLGLLISFLSYISRLYDPLRQIAAIWSSFQVALAGWDRIYDILSLSSDMPVMPREISETSPKEQEKPDQTKALLEFKHVFFKYSADADAKEILHDINFTLERGKTYALVGPTGGGKTTTAYLMARLYDATTGSIFLDGKNMQTYDVSERAKKIGFILQEPFLFTGTVRDNILYGNEEYAAHSNDEIEEVLKAADLGTLLDRFDGRLSMPISTSGNTLSLGQKQLIAFIRAVLRNPELLILDEATANIDTITEQILEDILKKLPKETTKVIIAHRLNTIENADEIFFVNAGHVTRAGSMHNAVDMLLHGKRES